jgi:hypothetical protein
VVLVDDVVVEVSDAHARRVARRGQRGCDRRPSRNREPRTPNREHGGGRPSGALHGL